MRNHILKTINFNEMIFVSRIIISTISECSIDLKKVPVYPVSGLFARLLISCVAFENPARKINASCKGSRNSAFFILKNLLDKYYFFLVKTLKQTTHVY